METVFTLPLGRCFGVKPEARIQDVYDVLMTKMSVCQNQTGSLCVKTGDHSWTSYHPPPDEVPCEHRGKPFVIVPPLENRYFSTKQVCGRWLGFWYNPEVIVRIELGHSIPDLDMHTKTVGELIELANHPHVWEVQVRAIPDGWIWPSFWFMDFKSIKLFKHSKAVKTTS